MYSGITQGLFPVCYLEKKPGLLIYSVCLTDELLENLQIGASVSIDGVCQTVVAIAEQTVTFNAIQETLDKTTLSQLQLGSLVSVERSIGYGQEIGGHEVAGHIIGMGQIVEIIPSEHNLQLKIQCDPEWVKYIFPKGFIAVDGSSLTVDQVDSAGSFTLHLIPETIRLTNLGHKRLGDCVNIELDQRTQTIVATVERVLAEMAVCSKNAE